MSLSIKNAVLESKKILNLDVKEDEGAIEKEQIAMETKADEVMHTTNTDFGKELVPVNVLTGDLEMIPEYSSLLSFFSGSHGTNMNPTEKVAIIGEADLFKGNSEYTTGIAHHDSSDNGPATSDITITQGQFLQTVALSRREMNYSIVDIERIVMDRLNRAAARTLDASFLNFDSATSGNVNLDGGTPSGTYYLQNDGGIRDTAIANGNVTTVGTLSESKFIDIMNLLDPGYGADYANLVWVMPRNVYNKCLLIDSLITRDKSQFDTFRTGSFGQIFGIDVVVARDMPALAQASGKVSSTAGSNTTGQIGLVYKPAVQYGWGMPLEIEPDRIPGKGVNLIATYEMGATIVYEKSGLGKTVALGVGVTL